MVCPLTLQTCKSGIIYSSSLSIFCSKFSPPQPTEDSVTFLWTPGPSGSACHLLFHASSLLLLTFFHLSPTICSLLNVLPPFHALDPCCASVWDAFSYLLSPLSGLLFKLWLRCHSMGASAILHHDSLLVLLETHRLLGPGRSTVSEVWSNSCI
jgi:hypothetical protein